MLPFYVHRFGIKRVFMATVHTGEKASQYLRQTFAAIRPGTSFRVKLSGGKVGKSPSNYSALAGVTGYSEETRLQSGGIGQVTSQKGSVTLYGESPPDYCLMLDIEGKLYTFTIDGETSLQRTGVVDSILSLRGKNWKMATNIDIFLKSIYTGTDGVQFFLDTVVKKVNDGEYAARLGKWVSKKSYDRSIKRADADKRAVSFEIENPEKESMNSTHIGGNLTRLDFSPGTSEKNAEHLLTAKHESSSTKINFLDVIVQHDVLGREIGAKQSRSTYVYFLGAPLSSPVNLLIIRHRSANQQ